MNKVTAVGYIAVSTAGMLVKVVIDSSVIGKDHRVNYTTGRNLCNGRNLVELVAVKCTTPVMEYDV